jgi:hypothetical protein
MNFDDFVWFWLADRDRMADTSVAYWFRCLDMDDDGFYLGELRSQRGLVPSNFLTEAPPDYDPSQPRHKRTSNAQGGPQDRSRERDNYYAGYF